MRTNEKIAAALAAATRKLVALCVALHVRQLVRVKKAAQARVTKAYAQVDEARAAEYAAKESWNYARADRVKAVANARNTALTASPTITAADCEIARYNG